MSRTAGSNGARTAETIRAAGLQLIFEHGYEAMSLRQLARMVGLQPASLYNYFGTKQDLLFGIVHGHMLELIQRTEAALDGSDGTATGRFHIFIEHHLRSHMKKKREVYVANFELRALTQPNYATILELRLKYERTLISILDDGVKDGSLDLPDTHIAAYALLAMLTGACTWYKPDGRLTESQVVAMHTALVMNGYAPRPGTIPLHVTGAAELFSGPSRPKLRRPGLLPATKRTQTPKR